jgi:CspA family cold shock protein
LCLPFFLPLLTSQFQNIAPPIPLALDLNEPLRRMNLNTLGSPHCIIALPRDRRRPQRTQSPPAAQPNPLSGRVRNGIVKRQQWRSTVALGTVKWFNSQKGYGFIQPQSGGKDVFVHISAVERAGLSGLNEGQVVEYEEVSNKGKTSAEHLKLQR